MTKKIRVLIVDDSSFLRRTLPRLLQADPEIEVVGTAANGAEGVELAKTLHPDVITLDVMMPVMDGLAALKQIMREAPTAVLMVSSVTTEGAHTTLDALAAGAVDFFAKPPLDFVDIDTRQAELIEKVKMAHHTPRACSPADVDATRDKFRALVEELQQGSPSSSHAPARVEGKPKRLVAIASSTGGPAALPAVVRALAGRAERRDGARPAHRGRVHPAAGRTPDGHSARARAGGRGRHADHARRGPAPARQPAPDRCARTRRAGRALLGLADSCTARRPTCCFTRSPRAVRTKPVRSY
jgi:DNA-binding NarL/FixJ family response regulator